MLLIKLKIAGGEPLLKFELVQRVLGYDKAETRRHQVLPNGTLMDLTKAHILKQFGAQVDARLKRIGSRGVMM